MAFEPADRLSSTSEYPFKKILASIKVIENKTGRKVLNFGPGNPDVPPSPIYVKKYQELVADKDAHLYPGYGSIPEFSQALISWYKERFNVELNENELHPLLGAKDGIAHLPNTILNPEDEILTPNPGYPGFTGPVELIGALPVSYDLSWDFKLDVDEIKSRITEKTKAIWVNFPSNPTGGTTTIDELEPLVQLAKDKKFIIIYDNPYSEITFDGYKAPSILEIEGAKDVAVELGSFSKSFSFAGYRMGWIVGNSEVIKALSTIKSQMDSGMSLPLQRLGAFALENPDEKWLKNTLADYKNRRDIIAKKLHKHGLEFNLTNGSLYIWAKIPNGYKDSEEFSQRMLEDYQVLLTPGSAFGSNGKNHIRASICIDVSEIDSYL